jgi:hypothetical protein
MKKKIYSFKVRWIFGVCCSPVIMTVEWKREKNREITLKVQWTDDYDEKAQED